MNFYQNHIFLSSTNHLVEVAGVEDKPCSGTLLTSTTDEEINKIKEFVLSNRFLTEKDLVDIIDLSKGSMQKSLQGNLV